MSKSTPIVATVVAGGTARPNQTSQRIILLNSDGTAASTVKKQAAQTNSTATDVAGLVTDFNALLVKLRAAGVIS